MALVAVRLLLGEGFRRRRSALSAARVPFQMSRVVEHHHGVYGGPGALAPGDGLATPSPCHTMNSMSKKQQDYWEHDVAHGPLVRLNVYDLADIGMCVDLSDALSSLNKHTMGLWEVGIFHAGVEIGGVEYSFGYCEYGTGVYACEPRQAAGARFRTSIKMGRARCTARMVEARLTALAASWSGSSYSLLHRNCCHFCDTLCFALGVGRVPPWVNGLAENLSRLSPFAPLPQTLIEARAKEHAAFRRPQASSTLAEERDEHKEQRSVTSELIVSNAEHRTVEQRYEQRSADLQGAWLMPFCAGIASCFSAVDGDRKSIEPHFRTYAVYEEDDDEDDAVHGRSSRLTVVYHTKRSADDSFWRRVQCCGDVDADCRSPTYRAQDRRTRPQRHASDSASLDRFFQTLSDEQYRSQDAAAARLRTAPTDVRDNVASANGSLPPAEAAKSPSDEARQQRRPSKLTKFFSSKRSRKSVASDA